MKAILLEEIIIEYLLTQKMKKPRYSQGFLTLKRLRKMGLEPTRCNHHKILSLARLPVPTLPLMFVAQIISYYPK